MNKELLISNDYRSQNQQCHEQDKGFGSNGRRWAPLVVERTKEFRNTIGTCRVLDYGCGQNLLWRELATNHQEAFDKIEFASYDPAVPKYSTMPRGMFDYVICTDLLEHVEPNLLDNVIEHVIKFAQFGIFFNMPYRLGNRVLPDGSPCHKTVKDAIWWMAQIHNKLTAYRRNWKMNLIPPDEVAWDINIWCKAP